MKTIKSQDVSNRRNIPPHVNYEMLKAILNKLKKKIQGKRSIMYFDIINFVIREGFKGEIYNQIILWCNYKIRFGEVFVEI
ncbi:MAG: hypothetical protein ACFFDN_33980 [Candidatus Hodarchaeota archaeon]